MAVSSPGGAREGILAATRRHGPELPIRVPYGVRPGERVAIYARGYLDRLISCMRTSFPAVRALLGDAMFDAFASEYLRAEPPRHYSLFELGAGFADYLEATSPPAEAVPAERRGLLRLPVDLARAERARLECMRASGIEDENHPGGRASDFDILLRRDVQLAAPPCLRTLELAHDVRPFLAAVDRGEAPPMLEARATHLAVSRVQYRILWTELSAFQRDVLVACRTPVSLSTVAGQLPCAAEIDHAAVLADLMLWLPVAEGLGLLAAHRAT